MIEVTKTAAQELLKLAADTAHPDSQVLRIYFDGYG